MKNSRVFENPTDCPVVHTMAIIGGRWKPIILYCLMGGKLRFGKVAQFIPTISRKILTEQLKELEASGLVGREEFTETPPRVEYFITEKGNTILPIITAMCHWGQHDMKDVKKRTMALA